MEDNILTQLATGSDPLIAVLSFAVLALSAAVIYMWKYTSNNTVTKEVYEDMKEHDKREVILLEKLITNQVIILERLKNIEKK